MCFFCVFCYLVASPKTKKHQKVDWIWYKAVETRQCNKVVFAGTRSVEHSVGVTATQVRKTTKSRLGCGKHPSRTAEDKKSTKRWIGFGKKAVETRQCNKVVFAGTRSVEHSVGVTATQVRKTTKSRLGCGKHPSRTAENKKSTKRCLIFGSGGGTRTYDLSGMNRML